MKDRRSTPRRNFSKAGSALTATFSANCTIEEISRHGARLRLSRPMALPLKFVLKFSDFGDRKTVTLVWQKGTLVGVSFARSLPLQKLERQHVLAEIIVANPPASGTPVHPI